MKKKITIESLGYKVVICLFTVLLIALLADIIIFSDSTDYLSKKIFLFPNSFIFISGLALVITGCLVSYKYERQKIFRVNIYLCLIIASTLLFVVQVFITRQMYFYPGWDAGVIRKTVSNINNYRIIDPGIELYYSIYPNNSNLTAILLVTERAFYYFGIFGYLGSLLVSNLLVNLAGVFTFLSTYDITHKGRYAAFSWIMFALLVALSPWISIPYSDTYSILFPILAFYLYVSRKPDKKYYFRWFIIGFLCLFGYTIKPTAIIVLIAIFIMEFWKVLTRFDKKVLIKNSASFILMVAAVVPVLLISAYSKNLLGFDIDKNKEFTLVHFAMMGLNASRDGVFSGDDVKFSASFSTVEARNDANMNVIKERLADFGLFGYVNFLGKKALVNFSDGSFGWSYEGGFYDELFGREGKSALFLRNLYYPDGNYYSLFLTGAQILWFVVLILLSGMSLLVKNPEYKSVAVVVIIIGISSFVMLFEARARYLFSYSSFFTMGAGIGLGLWMNVLKQLISNKKV